MKLTKIELGNLERLYINGYNGNHKISKKYWVKFCDDEIILFEADKKLFEANNIYSIFRFLREGNNEAK